MDVICFSDLKWDTDYQRPQYLLSRCARKQRVFYIEEPVIDRGPARLVVIQDRESSVWKVIPHLPESLADGEQTDVLMLLIDELLSSHSIQSYVLWYYSPTALDYTRHLRPDLILYDCITSSDGSDQRILDLEKELLERADLVITEGQELFQANEFFKASRLLFPGSVHADQFIQARFQTEDPADQAEIPHPRLGFFGMIDESIDLGLIGAIADYRPDWHLIFIGPITDINPQDFPQRENIHYLGEKEEKDLPSYLAGWDVALLPFRKDESADFVTSTQVPECLVGGCPVVSAPIPDIVRSYGKQGVVWIADTASQFIRSVDRAMNLRRRNSNWLDQVDCYLADYSWDHSWARIQRLISMIYARRQQRFEPGWKLAIG